MVRGVRRAAGDGAVPEAVQSFSGKICIYDTGEGSGLAVVAAEEAAAACRKGRCEDEVWHCYGGSQDWETDKKQVDVFSQNA